MVFTITKNVNINDEDKGLIWKQLLISFLASLPFFTHGVETTELSSSAHAGHFTSSYLVPWSTTALILSAAVSALIYSFMIDRFGRRCGIYIVSLMQGASCIPLFLTPNDISLIILHVFAGLSSGGLFTVIPTYIREISNDSIRGLTVSLMMVMTTAGYMMKLAMDDEGMMFLMVALIAVQLVGMAVMVESPSYLVMVGKIEAAKTNISKLKCLPEDNPSVTKELTILTNERDKARSNGKLSIIGIFRNLIYRDATKIGVVLYTTLILCGSIVFLDQDKTLVQLKMDIDPQKTLVISCMFAGSLSSVALIRFLDRKYLLTVSFTVMVLSMGVLGVYTQTDLTVSTYRLVPVVALGILVFAYGAAWGLPVLIMTEVYNFEIRATMLGFLYTYSQILKLAHVHTFQYVEEYMGIYTVFYVFAGINMYGGVYTLFGVPDLKDKTLRQIERQLKRVPLLKFNTK